MLICHTSIFCKKEAIVSFEISKSCQPLIRCFFLFQMHDCLYCINFTLICTHMLNVLYCVNES